MIKVILILFLMLPLSHLCGETKEPIHEWKVSSSGFGPIEIGMSIGEIEKAIGVKLKEEFIPIDGQTSPEMCHYASNKEKLPGISIMMVEKKLIRIDINEKGYQTKDGAVIGLSENKLKKLYKNHQIQGHHYWPNGHYITVVGKGKENCLLFETVNNEVRSFRMGECKAVKWVEGCF